MVKKDQYFVLSAPLHDDPDHEEIGIICLLDELGIARDYAKNAARSRQDRKFIVVQHMAAFAAFVAVEEVN